MENLPASLRNHRVQMGAVESVCDGEVRYAPIKSIWFLGMLGGAIVGGLLTFSRSRPSRCLLSQQPSCCSSGIRWAAIASSSTTASSVRAGSSERSIVLRRSRRPRWPAGPPESSTSCATTRSGFRPATTICVTDAASGTTAGGNSTAASTCDEPPTLIIEPRLANDPFLKFHATNVDRRSSSRGPCFSTHGAAGDSCSGASARA